jgi:hypothetical protein
MHAICGVEIENPNCHLHNRICFDCVRKGNETNRQQNNQQPKLMTLESMRTSMILANVNREDVPRPHSTRMVWKMNASSYGAIIPTSLVSYTQN